LPQEKEEAMQSLVALVEQLGCPHLLVVGDLMVDRYTQGAVERVSPEAPVLVVCVEEQEARPGGAASVAALARGLGAEVSLAGVIGDDAPGRQLCQLLEEVEIGQLAVLRDDQRPTTTKERILAQTPDGRSQPVLRVDREWRQVLRPDLGERLLRLVSRQLEDCQALLVSDYAKGVCSPGLLERLLALAARHDVPVLVDPACVADYRRYQGASLLSPNRREAELVTGCPIRGGGEALAAGQRLCQEYEAEAVLVKLDGDGLVLVEGDQGGQVWPVWAREVRDVTGAGDMVLAMAGLCRAGGLDWSETAQLANVAAGLEVQRQGVAVVSRAEVRAALLPGQRPSANKVVTREELAALAESYRSEGRTMVLTNGCFDLLHAGHVRCLEEVAQLGDIMVVALNSDRSVRRLKGAGRPVVAEADRAAVVAALRCVDHVVLFDEETPHALLRQVRPDVLAKGGTYDVNGVVGREVVESYGGRVCVTEKVDGISTSALLDRLRTVPAIAAAR
jgi:D-beta-D-heptose 7-phosphate kinase/D-beta-D-heptose 1-phosphate adenosyltransferase